MLSEPLTYEGGINYFVILTTEFYKIQNPLFVADLTFTRRNIAILT